MPIPLANAFLIAPIRARSTSASLLHAAFRLLLFVLSAALLSAVPVRSAPKNKSLLRKHIVVFAERVDKEIGFRYQGVLYTGRELNDALGEWHIDASKDSEIVVVLQDNMFLSDIKDVPAMAMRAGFSNVRVFVFWKHTGNMAEVLFGPVVNLD
jgi:hypothetical protein